jgi:hypothetical protein
MASIGGDETPEEDFGNGPWAIVALASGRFVI